MVTDDKKARVNQPLPLGDIEVVFSSQQELFSTEPKSTKEN